MALKEMRLKKGFTQVDVGKRLNIGQSTVAMWESGANMPRADKLLALARLYECTVEELLAENGNDGGDSAHEV